MFITRVVVMPILLAGVLLPVAFGDDTPTASAMPKPPRTPETLQRYRCVAWFECQGCLHGRPGYGQTQAEAEANAIAAAKKACEYEHGDGNCAMSGTPRCGPGVLPVDQDSPSSRILSDGSLRVMPHASDAWVIELKCICCDGVTKLNVHGHGCCKEAAYRQALGDARYKAQEYGGLRCCNCRIIQRPCCCRPCRPCR